MKTLPVIVIVCVVMTLTGADAPPEAKSSDIHIAKSQLIKRSTHCPGWSEYNGRCFIFIPTHMTWARAERNCQSLGGNLASVRDVFEYQAIQKVIWSSTYDYPESWVGGSDAQEENIWLWSDGTPFHYSNWCRGEPSHYNHVQRCIEINYGGSKCWDDVQCYIRLPSVCAKKKISIISTMKTLPLIVFVCVVLTLTGADAWSCVIRRYRYCSGWSRYKGRYFIYIPTPMTWARAEKNCQSLGGNLASVRNIYEYHKIQWLILHKTHRQQQAWIGGSDCQQNGVWLWSDGTRFHYSNWCPGEPNNGQRAQHCLQINYGASKCWDDVQCNVHRPSVCAKKIR
ncbi:ladderlectin-like [Mugil cephalus]|uniref:ladderlectin-like n=1 Tax=Mugil cephalus TaxID=48193 RepID=UPI001FB68BC6|nr:ladderlectin-like [Mugil cephalus]